MNKIYQVHHQLTRSRERYYILKTTDHWYHT